MGRHSTLILICNLQIVKAQSKALQELKKLSQEKVIFSLVNGNSKFIKLAIAHLPTTFDTPKILGVDAAIVSPVLVFCVCSGY